MRPDRAFRRPNTPLGPEQKHYWLVMRMADATGVDLVQAMRDGRLTQSDWARMVNRCRSCDRVEGCQRWLGRPDGADARPVPEGCLNRKRFAELMEIES